MPRASTDQNSVQYVVRRSAVRCTSGMATHPPGRPSTPVGRCRSSPRPDRRRRRTPWPARGCPTRTSRTACRAVGSAATAEVVRAMNRSGTKRMRGLDCGRSGDSMPPAAGSDVFRGAPPRPRRGGVKRVVRSSPSPRWGEGKLGGSRARERGLRHRPPIAPLPPRSAIVTTSPRRGEVGHAETDQSWPRAV